METFTTENFKAEVLESGGLVIVDFWAAWCGPCKMLGPIMEDLAKDFEDNDSVTIGKLNVDENGELAQQYQVMSIPAVKFFKNGEVVDEIVGLKSKEEIMEKINKLVV